MPRHRGGAPHPVLLGLLGVALAGGVPGVAPSVASAQRAPAPDPHDHGDVSGVVRDSAARPLAAARVRLVEAHREYLTHEDGRFVFRDLPAGRYTLEVRRLGHVGDRRAVIVSRGSAERVELVLRPSAVQLSTVVTTGTLVATRREDVLSPTSVLADAALDRRLDGTVAGTLAGQPGVSMTSMGPATGRPVIRGLSGDRILVLEDGQRPGDLSSTSGDHAVAVDALTARQLEVVRGPMSLLYGSSALGGVINVVREEVPTSMPEHGHGVVSAQAASVNRGGTVGGTWTDHAGPVAVRAEASYRGAGDLRTPLGALQNTQLRTYGGALGAALVGHDGHVGASYRYFANDYGLPGGFIGTHPEGVDIDMRRHTGRVEGELHEHAGPFESVRVVGAFTNYQHAERERNGEIGTFFGQRLAQGEVVARHGARGPFASGAVGVRGQFRDLTTAGALRTPPTRDWTAAAFLVEEVGTGPLRVQGGLRYDLARFTPQRRRFIEVGGERLATDPRSFGAFSGSLGALWAPGAGLRVGGSVSRAYRTPDFNELYSAGPHLAAYSYDVGNPRLGEETGLGIDAFVRLERRGVRAELAAYRNALSNYVYPRNTGELGPQGGRPKFQFTGVDALLTGAEAEVEWSVAPRLVVEGTASYVLGRLRGAPDSLPAVGDVPARLASRSLPFIPPLNGRVGLRYERPRWFAGVGSRLAARQTRLGDFETPTAGYALADLNAGLRLLVGSRLHTLTLRLDNLLDQEYRDHLSRTRVIMPEAGRNVSLLYRVSL
jgi:iron complex outermembrane receptor protein